MLCIYIALHVDLCSLQELEYKNAALQTELAALQSVNRKETEQLSNKLE